METNEKHTDTLEQMRHEMDELRQLLAGQQIVNARLMRRAMNADMSREKRDIRVSIAVAVLNIPVVMYLLPTHLGMPMWFAAVTVAFFLVCCAASVWSLRQLSAEDIITGNLVTVAERIVAYKRFGNRWLCGAIPAVAVWLAGFVYCASASIADAGQREGFFWGCGLGLVIGGAVGAQHLRKSRRRLDGMLRQIDELKNAE